MNRFTPARSAARTSRSVATASSSSIEPPGWSRIAAARWTTVSTPRIALRNDAGFAQVAERDLHAHALGPEPARVAHEAADGLAGGRQAAQERRADRAGGAGEEDQNQCRCSRQGSASLW